MNTYEVYRVTGVKTEMVHKGNDRDTAVEIAKYLAEENSCIYEVTRIDEFGDARTCAYHSDGTIEKLW